jgi:hypothetical protein
VAYEQRKERVAEVGGISVRLLDRMVREQRARNAAGGAAWFDDLIYDLRHGYDTIHNVTVVLDKSAAFHNKIRFNELTNATEATAMFWWPKKAGWQQWGDADDIAMPGGFKPRSCMSVHLPVRRRYVG